MLQEVFEKMHEEEIAKSCKSGADRVKKNKEARKNAAKSRSGSREKNSSSNMASSSMT